jgi:hypothetical protein
VLRVATVRRKAVGGQGEPGVAGIVSRAAFLQKTTAQVIPPKPGDIALGASDPRCRSALWITSDRARDSGELDANYRKRPRCCRFLLS